MSRPDVVCLLNRSLLAAVCAVGLASAGFTQTDAAPSMAQIESAFAEGDLTTARTGLEQLLQVNPTPLGQFRYGRMLVEGMGGPVDLATGMRWLQQAADQGYLPAFTLMARVFLSSGQTGDAQRAATLLRQAATRGEPEAKFYFALLNAAGTGVAQDLDAAFAWMRAAAEDGYPQAQFDLSKYFADGIGTQANPDEAERWLRKAATSGLPAAEFAVAVDLQSSGQPAQDYAPMFRRAAAAGVVPAQSALGTLYLVGALDVQKDADLALDWLTRAAEAGDVSAMHNLGIGYLGGQALSADPDRATYWFTRASDAGLARSTFALARMAERNVKGGPDPEEAVDLLRLAYSQGSKPAAQKLGERVLSETLTVSVAPHDAVPWVMALIQSDGHSEALAWMNTQAAANVRPAQAALGLWYLEQPGGGADAQLFLTSAASAGHVPSQFRLGQALATGAGLPLDYQQAHMWLNVAAASGHAQAAALRDTLTAVMTPDQIAAAQDATRAYFDAAKSTLPAGALQGGVD